MPLRRSFPLRYSHFPLNHVIGCTWIHCITMAQALLQLLALCLDLIFRFVPSNGFANEEVRDENHHEECEGKDYYNEGSRHEYSVPRILTEETFSTDIQSPRVFTQQLRVR